MPALEAPTLSSFIKLAAIVPCLWRYQLSLPCFLFYLLSCLLPICWAHHWPVDPSGSMTV